MIFIPYAEGGDRSPLPVARRASLWVHKDKRRKPLIPITEKSWKTALEKAANALATACQAKNTGPRGWQSLLNEGTKEGNQLDFVCQTCWKWTFFKLILFKVFKAWEHNKCYLLSDFSSIFWPWHGGVFSGRIRLFSLMTFKMWICSSKLFGYVIHSIF